MKILIIIVLLFVLLSSCTNGKNDFTQATEVNSDIESTAADTTDDLDNSQNNQQETYSELIRTGEIYTAEQMEVLTSQAFSWQSTTAGVGRCADIIWIESSDDLNQQVFISFYDQITYEKVQIQAPDGTQAYFYGASSGAGSGEVVLEYKFTTEESEWIEYYLADAGLFMTDNEAKFVNITEAYR